ncbi:MAG: AAC(3) family N-acetyltransferase [Planctomycetaceae bacterium]|nr:AAC(3) family N-acetyltransferase [Planctomycetaceae bacterium]
MSERDVVNETPGLPATMASLASDLADLGVETGAMILVHASLSSLGWVCGGAVAVIEALSSAVGPGGTIVMPAMSWELSDPTDWEHPPVPRDWWPIIRRSMPAFDPQTTPTRQMGAIAECFRSYPGVLRSDHPHESFAAMGPHAGRITAEHPLEDGFGNRSPLGRLYDLQANVLLLGVGHDRNSSLHLAEVRALGDTAPKLHTGAPVLIDGQRRWVEYSVQAVDESDFPQLGRAFADATGLVRSGRIAQAHSMLMPQPALVDFGAEWLKVHRS